MGEKAARQSGPGRRGRRMAMVPLALTAVVVGLILYIYMGWRGSESNTPTGLPPSRPPASLAQKVLAAARPLMKTRQYAPAQDLMLAYLREHPADVEVRPLLAEAQFGLGQAEAAEHTVDDLLRLWPGSARGLWLKGELVRNRKGPNYMHFFELAAEKSDDANAEIWTKYAMELLAGGKEDQAERYLRKALDEDPKDVRAMGVLAAIHLRRDRFDQAAELLTDAVKIERTDPQLWEMLADARKNSGKLDAALSSIQEALKVRRSGPALMMLGEIRLLQSKRQEAAEAFASASDYPAVRGEAAFRAARCYYFTGRYGLAMKYIDLAAAALGKAEVQEWKSRIEDARFGPVEATTQSALPPGKAAGGAARTDR